MGKPSRPNYGADQTFLAKVGSDGRITIPLANRELLNIKEGQIVSLVIRDVVTPSSDKK